VPNRSPISREREWVEVDHVNKRGCLVVPIGSRILSWTKAVWVLVCRLHKYKGRMLVEKNRVKGKMKMKMKMKIVRN
jgi:hypothetical protein